METLLGGIVGFTVFTITSHPKSPLNKKIPKTKIKNLHLLPSIKIEAKKRTLHIHHWMIFGSALVALVAVTGFIKSEAVTGFMSGSFIQGLTYKDRFNVFQTIHEHIKHPRLVNK